MLLSSQPTPKSTKGVTWWDGRLTGEDSFISFISDSSVTTNTSTWAVIPEFKQRLAGQTVHCVRCHAIYNPGINYWGACRLAHVFDGGILGIGFNVDAVRMSEETAREGVRRAREALEAGPLVHRSSTFWKRAVCCPNVFLQETAPGSDSWGEVQGPGDCYVGYHSTTPAKVQYNATSQHSCSPERGCPSY